MILERLLGRRSAEAGATLDTPGATRVLMVCMGNICRSPTAEVVLRAKLRAAGLHHAVAVDSAGTSGHQLGQPPDARAIRHGALRGYDLAPLRARGVVAVDYTRFHWMLAMDEDNLRLLRRQQPADASAHTALLMSYAPQFGEREIADPYYGAAAGFERVLDLVEAACDGFVAELARGLRDGRASATDRTTR